MTINYQNPSVPADYWSLSFRAPFDKLYRRFVTRHPSGGMTTRARRRRTRATFASLSYPLSPTTAFTTFENQVTATAPAQTVVVTTQLDVTTFRFGEIGFAGFVATVPAGVTAFATRVDAEAALGVFVNVAADLNPATGLVNWTFTAMDPRTLDLPTGNNALEGFLFPEDGTGRGVGFVTYSVHPSAVSPLPANTTATKFTVSWAG